MRILSIEKSPRGGKYIISFDDGSEVPVSREVLIDFGLRKNDEVAADRLEFLKETQAVHEAYNAAGRLLNYRMRTRAELEQRLKKKGFQDTVVDNVMQKLSKLGLIDDVRFADAFVATKVASRPVGRRELERGLRERGVSKGDAERALSHVSDEETQLNLALRAAETKLRSLARFEQAKRRDKLISFLARRGFDWDVIKQVTRRVFEGNEDAVDL